eukprot:2978262-Prymnesium_polylepis.1
MAIAEKGSENAQALAERPPTPIGRLRFGTQPFDRIVQRELLEDAHFLPSSEDGRDRTPAIPLIFARGARSRTSPAHPTDGGLPQTLEHARSGRVAAAALISGVDAAAFGLDWRGGSTRHEVQQGEAALLTWVLRRRHWLHRLRHLRFARRGLHETARAGATIQRCLARMWRLR